MARSDLLVMLVKAGIQGDRNLFQRTVDAIVAEERAKQHHIFADQLEQTVRRNGNGHTPAAMMNGTVHSLLNEVTPVRSFDTLVLTPEVRQACGELVEEQRRADLLRSYNLEPRHRLLLVGPPGNGKTCLAEAIATDLALPLFSVRYEGIVGSFLGETASRLLKVFEHVVTRPCVLFFDEFDTLGKERGDVHDTGEIKRVVSSLLLQIDRLPSYVVVVAATNHQELLDRAVWRRFQIRLELTAPKPTQVAEWFRMAALRWKLLSNLSQPATTRLRFESFAEMEEFTLDVLRRNALAAGESGVATILAERIAQWRKRPRKKSR